MANSIYGTHNVGIVAAAATEVAPAVGYSFDGVLGGVTADGLALNVMTVKHTGTTDGTTTTTSWLHVKVTDINNRSFTDVLLPGDKWAYKENQNNNDILSISLWATTAGTATTSGSDPVCVIVGGMIKN